jgi:hypothetical protein
MTNARRLFAPLLFLVTLSCGAPTVRPPPRDAGVSGDGGAPAHDGGADGGADAGVTDGTPIDGPIGEWIFVPVEGTKCGAGAQAGIGFNRSAEDEDLFIFLQGGGACWNQGTCVPSLLQFGPLCDYATTCLLDAAGGQKPTSVYVTHPNPFPPDGGGFFTAELNTVRNSLVFDRSLPDNPFRAASFVFVPYCTGDLHAGSAEKDYQYKYNLFDQPSRFTMHFRGADNMDRYLARLTATFPDVKRVWLTGASAGAYGATLNFERVRRAFPGAEVHLLADSSPFITPVRWSTWRDTWNLQFPEGCADCDAGFPQVMQHLFATYPDSRLGLLAYERDRVIAWFFYAPPGLASFLDPPLNTYASNLGPLLGQYDMAPNAQYFVLPGEEHVMWGGYGSRRADGGTTPAVSSRDGGTTLRAWVHAWATGDGGWTSTR